MFLEEITFRFLCLTHRFENVILQVHTFLIYIHHIQFRLPECEVPAASFMFVRIRANLEMEILTRNYSYFIQLEVGMYRNRRMAYGRNCNASLVVSYCFHRRHCS